MVDQLARQPLIPLMQFSKGAGEQQPYPPRDADLSPETASPGQLAAGEELAAEAERSWIDELAAALRELARQSSSHDEETKREGPDEPAP